MDEVNACFQKMRVYTQPEVIDKGWKYSCFPGIINVSRRLTEEGLPVAVIIFSPYSCRIHEK